MRGAPDHHPPDDMLAAYAAGGSPDGEGLLVATHLALCPVCRAVCDGYDALGGALLANAEAAPLPDAALEAVLARLDEPAPAKAPSPPPSGPGDVPMPLRAVTGRLKDVPFRRVAPGIRRWDLPISTKQAPVALVGVRPNLAIPPHRHAATERGLVLTGGFTDEVGHFVRGDVCVRGPDEAEPHRQRIDDGEECVILMVDDGPKLPTTAVGRVVNFLFGL